MSAEQPEGVAERLHSLGAHGYMFAGGLPTDRAEQVTITLITALHECPKCAKCEAMIGRLMEVHPGGIEFRKVPADAPEAADYGVVMPPMVIVDDFIACAGKVPLEGAFAKLVANQLAGEQNP
ncbi:MAG: hypothetical protein COY42_24110 [Armatimonadetes bacterium CG_4_10_14_0_8_um_filter_66_14]|nr:MAG: hypothetical protein COY42_24110 [Armatimonadetes bacterium CG_4_10_14_0_8_um_filter_66_14]